MRPRRSANDREEKKEKEMKREPSDAKKAPGDNSMAAWLVRLDCAWGPVTTWREGKTSINAEKSEKKKGSVITAGTEQKMPLKRPEKGGKYVP